MCDDLYIKNIENRKRKDKLISIISQVILISTAVAIFIFVLKFVSDI